MGINVRLRDCLKSLKKVYGLFVDRKEISSPEEVVEKYVRKNKVDDVEEEFLLEAMKGLERYKGLFTVLLSALYQINREATVKDSRTYEILIYFGLIRIDDFGVEKFQLLSRNAFHTVNRLISFLRFLYDPENFSLIEKQLIKKYDHVYVQEVFLKSLENVSEELLAWADSLERKFEEDFDESSLPKVTEPKPFNLTKPKLKFIPEPEVIQTTIKTNEVPESNRTCDENVKKVIENYAQGKKNIPIIPKEIQDLNRTKQEKLQKKEFFTNLNKRKEKQRTLRDTERKEEKKRLKEEEEKKRKIKIKPIHEVKKILNRPAQVRLNTAAMLREDNNYKRKQQKEAELLKMYETELRDASEFERIQEELRIKEEEERLLKVKQLKLEMELVDARAKQARIDQEEANKAIAKEYRETAAEEIERVKMEKALEKKKKKEQAQIAAKVIKTAVKKSKKLAIQEKEKIGRKIRLEKRKHEMQVAKELELERQRKEDYVMQVRAREVVPKAELPKFDPTTPQELGLLGEMSFVEMKERLEAQKLREEAELEMKQKEIMEEKRKKKQELKERSERIMKYRQMARSENMKQKIDKLQKKQYLEKQSQLLMDDKILELQERILKQKEKQRLEKEQREEEERKRVLKAQFLAAEKMKNQQKHKEDLEKGKLRKEKQLTRKKMLEEKREKEIIENERKRKVQIKRAERERKEKTFKKMDSQLKEKTAQGELDSKREARLKALNAKIRKKYEERMTQRIKTQKDPFEYGSTHRRIAESEAA